MCYFPLSKGLSFGGKLFGLMIYASGHPLKIELPFVTTALTMLFSFMLTMISTAELLYHKSKYII